MAVKSCSCKNVYQDQKYGPGRRVMNPAKKDKTGHNAENVYACTSCGEKHTNPK